MQENESLEEDTQEAIKMNINEFIATARKYLFATTSAERAEVLAEQR